jgi:hypothetical protein
MIVCDALTGEEGGGVGGGGGEVIILSWIGAVASVLACCETSIGDSNCPGLEIGVLASSSPHRFIRPSSRRPPLLGIRIGEEVGGVGGEALSPNWSTSGADCILLRFVAGDGLTVLPWSGISRHAWDADLHAALIESSSGDKGVIGVLYPKEWWAVAINSGPVNAIHQLYILMVAYLLSKFFHLVGRSFEDVASGVRNIVKMGVFGIQLPWSQHRVAARIRQMEATLNEGGSMSKKALRAAGTSVSDLMRTMGRTRLKGSSLSKGFDRHLPSLIFSLYTSRWSRSIPYDALNKNSKCGVSSFALTLSRFVNTPI